jgi:hypothetical protein
MTEHNNTKKGPDAGATARGPIPTPRYQEKDMTIIADPTPKVAENFDEALCARGECDGFQAQPSHHLHTVTLPHGTHLAGREGGCWMVRIEMGDYSQPEALKDLAREIRTAASMIRDLATHAPTDLPARHVRGLLTAWDWPARSPRLRELLEVSPKRARDLYAGRARYSERELGVLAAYFGVEVRDFYRTEVGVKYTPPGQEAAARRAGEDRVVTYREECAA